MHFSRTSATAAAGLLLASGTAAIDVDATSDQSLKDAASTIAASVMSRYEGNADGNIPGLFPDPYYFWEGGLAWDSMIQYANLTGDDQYNDAITEAMLWQVGPDYNFMPPNQSKSLGNDDQSFWALAAMTAEETGFALPEDADVGSWLQLAQNVFDSQVMRWDNDTCGGGLRWQIYSFNNGYDYKNSFSNGNFMELAARLYAATKNETYADWFDTTAAWMTKVGLYNNKTGQVFDGTNANDICADLNHLQWTATTGMLLSAYSAMMSAGKSTDKYTQPLNKLLSGAQVFTGKNNSILLEVACQPSDNCNVDQKAFRAVLARALGNIQNMAYVDVKNSPEPVQTILQASAEAAGTQCSGGDEGTSCGGDWTQSKYDGAMGLGEDLSALNVMLANLPQKPFPGPGEDSGSTSTGSSSDEDSTTGGSETSSGDASGTSESASPSASVPVQDGNGAGVQRPASVMGLLGAVAAVAFFL